MSAWRPADAGAAALVGETAVVLVELLGGRLVGLYPFGSTAFGDYQAGISDVDLIGVVTGPIGSEPAAEVVERLRSLAMRHPHVAGLEVYLVTRDWARRLAPAHGWELALGLYADDDWVPDVDYGDPPAWNDATPVLAAAVAREVGAVVIGPPPDSLFSPVSRSALLEAARLELDFWLRDDVTMSVRTAVLNACRAWRLVEDGVLCSKLAGGEWARRRLADPVLVDAALALQRGVPVDVPSAESIRALVADVRFRLAAP